MGERLEQTIQVVEQLEEVLREGRILLKDIKHERKELERLLANTKDAVHKQAEVDVVDAIEKEVERCMDNVAGSIADAQEIAIQKVNDNFDKLAKMLTYGNTQGRGPDLIDQTIWKKRRAK